jgi:hypothetical protein
MAGTFVIHHNHNRIIGCAFYHIHYLLPDRWLIPGGSGDTAASDILGCLFHRLFGNQIPIGNQITFLLASTLHHEY